MATIEVRLRTFFKSDEADVCPSTTVTIDSADIEVVPWTATVSKLVDQMNRQLEGAPLTNVRDMTPEEVEAYLVEERTDDIVSVRAHD